MAGPTGPGEHLERNENQGASFVVESLSVLHCKTCEKDTLFARVKEVNTGKPYLFCSKCSEYTEVFEISKN